MTEDTANARALRLAPGEGPEAGGGEQEAGCEEVRTQATGQNV